MNSRISSGSIMLVVILMLHLDSSLYGQNWPMINLNKERTSWASDETILYPPLKQIDEIPIKSTGDYLSLSYLTYHNDLLVLAVGRNPNTVEAVNIASGDTLWTFEVPESKASMSFVCAQNDSMIFAGGQKGLGLYALDRETGDQKWHKPIGPLYTKSIILDSTSAYILGDSLYCISIKDGSTIWSRKMIVQSTPTVDDLYVYVVGIYKVQVFDKLSGDLVWWRSISERTTGGSVVDNDCFYTHSNDTIFAYNKGSWDIKWIYESKDDTLQYQAQNSIAITDSKLCFTISNNGEGNGELVTLDKETGGFLWATTFAGYYMFAPTIANGVVYVISLSESALYGFELESGAQLFYENSFSYWNQPIVANHQLFVVSRDRVIIFENTETRTDDSKETVLKTYELMQNSPNPFYPLTTIKYRLPQRAFVDLKIYNALGEEIYTLVNEERAPGLHSINFDGTHLASGLYYYKIATGTYVNTKQFILIK